MKLRTTIIGGALMLGLSAAVLSGKIDETYWSAHALVMGPPPAPDFTVPASNTGPQKVIYHVVEKGNWRNRDGEVIRLTAVLNNHIHAVEPDDVQIEVLMHGNGVDILKRAKSNQLLAARIDSLKRKGVKFTVCANTLQSNRITLADLHGATQADLAQSATARIIQLQQQGYGYIRF